MENQRRKSGRQFLPATEAAERATGTGGSDTELAKLKYQTAQGELKTLTEMQKHELLRNAALIDQQKIRKQLRSREETLKNDNVAARASNEAELLGYGQGERARERMRELQQIRTASARRMRTFSLSIRPGISVRIFTDSTGTERAVSERTP
ncbi:putative tail component of prophage [Escherichia coli]|uniref:Putative tail component of prophage n=1 Tax=Escherichia coli TaxID=562 RepID=A0A376W1Z1_ECOLX|nr:putative tail component of prophage [Escherichia coli]